MTEIFLTFKDFSYGSRIPSCAPPFRFPIVLFWVILQCICRWYKYFFFRQFLGNCRRIIAICCKRKKCVLRLLMQLDQQPKSAYLPADDYTRREYCLSNVFHRSYETEKIDLILLLVSLAYHSFMMLRNGVKSLSCGLSLSTLLLIAIKRTCFCGNIISV